MGNLLKKYSLLGLTLFLAASLAYGDIISRVKVFSDGEVLTAADLNTEYNNVVDGVNSITDANILSAAAISAAKISASIAGDGITRNSGTGVLAVNPDGTTLEINSDAVRIKDLGVSTAKIDSLAVTAAKLAADSVTTAKILDSNVTTAKINDGAVTPAKKAALGQQVSSSGSTSTASTSFIDATNLTVTITTTGRPVFLSVQGDGTANAMAIYPVFTTTGGSIQGSMDLKFVRDSTTVGVYTVGGIVLDFKDGDNEEVTTQGDSYVITGKSITHIDVVSAGTYVYKVQLKMSVGSSANLNNAKLVAFEL